MMPVKSYKSPSDFRKALEHRLQAVSAKTGQNLQHLRRSVAFNRFLARLFAHSSSPWILKGGYAMELRMAHARATRDIDLTLKGNRKIEGAEQASYIQDLLPGLCNRVAGFDGGWRDISV